MPNFDKPNNKLKESNPNNEASQDGNPEISKEEKLLELQKMTDDLKKTELQLAQLKDKKSQNSQINDTQKTNLAKRLSDKITKISARVVELVAKNKEIALRAAISSALLLVPTSAVAPTQPPLPSQPTPSGGGDLIRSIQRREIDDSIMPENIDELIRNGSIPQLLPKEVEELGAPNSKQKRNELLDAMGDEEEENTVMPEDINPTDPKTETIPFDEYRKNNPDLHIREYPNN